MSTPTVTITVAGSPVTSTAPSDPATLEASLHMLYVQAVKGEERKQWVIFPPAVEALGIDSAHIKTGSPVLQLARHQTFKGNRAKWFHTKVYPNTPGLTEDLTVAAADGWVVSGLTVIPLEKDDYQEVWAGETPHKALRAVGRYIEKSYGLSIK